MDESLDAQALRRLAEDVFRERPGPVPPDPGTLSEPEIRALVHELRVHQIELEMQNDELRRTQGHLDASRARYFDLYDLAPVGYCTLSAGGLILEANLAAAHLLGEPRATLLGQAVTRFILKADQDIYYMHRKKFLTAPGPHACELRMAGKDGREFWVQLTATDVPSAFRDPGEARAEAPSRLVLSDITDMKRAEADRTALATQLHKARKLETLGVMAAGVSRDFYNLLSAIMCNASTGSLVAEGNADLMRFFGAIETSALRATELVRQLLAYAGKAKWTLEEVDVGIVANEIGHTLTHSLPANLILECDLADRVPFWNGDSTQIYQVLMNLVMNAFEAFPEGAAGRIILRTRAERITAPLTGPGLWILPPVPGRYVMVEVADTGQGMAPDLLYHAFEPFYTTKSTGRGLGLAAVHGILSSHGCALWVLSEPGRGTSFRIYLPAMVREREPGGEILWSWRGQGLILVVDGHKGGRTSARQLAQRFGFTVLEARGGLEAVETFQQRRGELALVLLDRDLQGTSARDAFRRMQELDSSVPVVFTGAHDGRDLGPQAWRPPETLWKPYRPAEFQGALHRALKLSPRA